MASETEDPAPGSRNASVGDVAQQEPGPTDLSQIPFEPGQLIHGKYELLRLLGSGGVGYVVAARHIGFDDLVALKFLRPEFATHQEAVSRFTIEARASFRLRSEHVARMLDVDIHDGVPFIAMELLEGQDLRNVLEARRVLEVAPTVDYLLQTCEALAAAHAIGVIHRDIKPENLFLLGNGDGHEHLKVLDFGISKVAVRGDNRKTHQALTRLAVGTPPYMSPEQVRASSALDARSDIWSVGCVLYELLTGTAPFDRVSLMQACAAVLEDEPLAPHELNAQVPEGLSAIVMRCLRKDPNDRFPDVASLAEALSTFGSGRFASYAARCRAHLAGEGPGRRSTPTGYTSVQRLSVPPGAPPARSITVRLESHAPLTRRVTTGPGPASKPVETPAPAVASAATVAAISREDSTSFRAPRRRAVQAFAWGVPLIIGGVLATYLATAEQRARSAGPAPRSPSEHTTDVQAASDDGSDRGPAPKPHDLDNRGNKLDSLPSGSDGTAVSNTAEELAQAAGSAAVLDEAASQAERDRGTGRPINLSSSAKKAATSTHSSESKTKSRANTRTSGAPIKPVEPAAVPARSSDPDVGF